MPTLRVRAVVAGVVGWSVLAGCSASSAKSSTAPASSQPGASTAPMAAATVWLCQPGQEPDPCALNRAATSEPANGSGSVNAGTASVDASKFDCFYVYPTVSTQTTPNANLTVPPAETAAAFAQASRFSQVCRVWAPMYRQRTNHDLLSAGLGGDVAAQTVAYDSVLSAWRDYLAHDNDGRPIVFIGHSQGGAILIRLLETQVDPSPTLRAKLVSALILGGNVEVPPGKTFWGLVRTHPDGHPDG